MKKKIIIRLSIIVIVLIIIALSLFFRSWSCEYHTIMVSCGGCPDNEPIEMCAATDCIGNVKVCTNRIFKGRIRKKEVPVIR